MEWLDEMGDAEDRIEIELQAEVVWMSCRRGRSRRHETDDAFAGHEEGTHFFVCRMEGAAR